MRERTNASASPTTASRPAPMVVQFQYTPADYRKRLQSTQQNRRRRRREPSPYDDASLSSSSSFLKVDPTATGVVAKQNAHRSSPFFVPESPTFLTHGYRRSKTPTSGDIRPFWHHSYHPPEPRRAKSEPRASQQEQSQRPPRPLLAAERFCDQEYLDSQLVAYRKTLPAPTGSPNNHSNASSDQTRSNRANHFSTNPMNISYTSHQNNTTIDTNTSFSSRKSSPEIWIEPEFLTKKKSNNKKHQKQVQHQQHLQKVLFHQYRHLQKQQEQQQQQRSQSAPKTITIPSAVATNHDQRHHYKHRNPTTSNPRSYAAEYYAKKRASSVPRKVLRERTPSPDPIRVCVRTGLQYWGDAFWSSNASASQKKQDRTMNNPNTSNDNNNTMSSNDPDSNIPDDVCCGGTDDVLAEDTPDASRRSRNTNKKHHHSRTNNDHHLFFLDAKALADNLSASNVDEERKELDGHANKLMKNWTQCSPQNSCSPKQPKTRQRASPSRKRLTVIPKQSSPHHRRKKSSSNHSILEDTSTSSESHNTSSNNHTSCSSSSSSSSDDMLPRPPKTFNTVRQSPSSHTPPPHSSQQPSPVSVADWFPDQPGENWTTTAKAVQTHPEAISKEDSSTEQRRRRRPLGVYEQTMTTATTTIASTPDSKKSVPFDEAAKRARDVEAFNKEIARFELIQREQQIMFEEKHKAMSLKYSRALEDLATQGESIQKLQKELKETTQALEQTRIDMLQYKAAITKRSQKLEEEAEQTFQERIEIEEKLRKEMLANREFKDQVLGLKREVARLTVMLKFAREGRSNNADDVPSILAASTSSGSESLPGAADGNAQRPEAEAASSAQDDEKTQQIERLMADLLSLRSDVVELRAQLADARAERLSTDAQMQQLKQDRDEAQEQVTMLNSALEKLQKETKDLKDEADASQQKEMEDVGKVKEELAMVRKQLEETNQQTGLYAERSQKLQEELSELQAVSTKHQEHAAKLLRQLEETRSEADEKIRVSDMETKKLQDELRQMKDNLSQRNSEIICQATEHLQERKRIEEELEKTREIAQVLQSKVVSLGDQIAQTETAVIHSQNQGEGNESKATGLNPASLMDILWKKF